MKRNIYIISMLLLADFSMSSCNIKTSESSKMSDSDRKEAIEDTLGRGELGLFDLRGPVERCTWTDRNEVVTDYTFNEKGFLITINGKKLDDVFPIIKRDEEGRIVYGGTENETLFTCEYNGEGLVTKVISTNFYTNILYNAHGNIIAEQRHEQTIGGGGRILEEEISLNFTPLQEDEYGNWAQRATGGHGLENRTITYY